MREDPQISQDNRGNLTPPVAKELLHHISRIMHLLFVGKLLRRHHLMNTHMVGNYSYFYLFFLIYSSLKCSVYKQLYYFLYKSVRA